MEHLASLVSPTSVDGPHMMARRLLDALEKEETIPWQERTKVQDAEGQRGKFTTCAHCAIKFRRVKWRRWAVWQGEVRFMPESTIAAWTNQVPPRQEETTGRAGLMEAYQSCVVAGTLSDDYGQFMPGRQLRWEEAYNRREQGNADDEEVIEFYTYLNAQSKDFFLYLMKLRS